MYKVRSHISTIGQLKAEVLSHSIADMFKREKPYTARNRLSLKSKKTNGNLYYKDTSNICLDDEKLSNSSSKEEFRKLIKKGSFLDKGQIHYKANYYFNGDCYNIQKPKGGLCIPILNTSLEILYHAKEKWKRVCMIRFDLSQKGIVTVNSSHVSKFVKNLNRRLERKYKHLPFYIWVREVGKKEGGQHYHFALFLNGNKVNKSNGLIKIVEETWQNINDKNHLYLPKNSYCFIDGYKDCQDKMEEAVFRLSYLSKVDTKTENPLHKNNYSSSRIKKK